MTQSKSPTTTPTQSTSPTVSASDKAATAGQLVPQAAARPQPGDFLALGQLRRDVLVLGTGTEEELTQMAKEAITAGRIAAAFVIPIVAHFNESAQGWNETNLVNAATAGSVAQYNGELAPETVKPNGANPGVAETSSEGDDD